VTLFASGDSVMISDALGLGRLAADAAEGITGLVEHMHMSILETPGLAPLAEVPTGVVTQLVYRGVRGAFRLTGVGVGAAAGLVGATPDDRSVSRGREIALAVLNGVVGDHLSRLAIRWRSPCGSAATAGRSRSSDARWPTRSLRRPENSPCSSTGSA
jgi:hypothetical protein